MKVFKKTIALFAAICTALCINSAAVSVSAESAEIHGDLRFDFITDSDGFEVESGCTIDGVTDGKLMLTPTGQDPRIRTRNIKIYSDEYKYVRIKMKNNTTSTSMRMWIIGEEWNNHIYLSETIKSKQETTDFVEYTIPIDYAKYNGNPLDVYVRLRFDFMGACAAANVNGTCEVDSIVFSKYESPQDDGIIKQVALGGNSIEDFSCDKDYYETELFEDEYNAISSEDGVGVTLGDEYSDADVNYTVTNLEGRKVVDINAVRGDYVRTFRFVISAKKRPVFLAIDRCESSGKTIEFSGTATNDAAQPVSKSICVTAEDSSGNIKYMNIVTSDESGAFGGTIKIYDDEQVERYETINVIFDAVGAEEATTMTRVYMNRAQILKSIQELKSYSGGVFEFINLNEKNLNVFGQLLIWIDDFNNLKADKKQEIEDALKDRVSKFDIDNISSEINGTILAKTIADMSVDRAVSEIERFEKATKSFNIENKAFSDLYDTSKNWIAKNLIDTNKSGFKNGEDFCDTVRENMLLSMVNNIHYLKLKDLLLNNTDIIGDSLAKLKNQTNTDILDNAMKILSEKANATPFTTVEQLLTNINSALSAAQTEYDNKNSNKSNGSSSGGGGGGRVNVDITPSTPNNPTPSNPDEPSKHTFSDMDGFDWAVDATDKLSESGIIGGIGNGKFEPSRGVTREEFVKMICGGFGFDAETAQISESFDDVKSTDWFFGYVSKAAELNIVKGITNSHFGSGEYVTRQDAATIISRAFDACGKSIANNGELSFEDSDEISDYAKAAVSSLCGIGVLNGTGDNHFEPARNLNRAEAAVIVYRSINNLNK